MASARRTGTNENISTFGAAGFGRDYTALETWETDTDNDLVTAAQSEVVECYADAAQLTVNSISVAGATCNSNYHRIIRAEPNARHQGNPANAVTFYTSTSAYTIYLGESVSELSDIVSITEMNSVGSSYSLYDALGGNAIRWVACLTKGTNPGSGGSSGMVTYGGVIIDCVAYECETSGFLIRNTVTIAYNCTAVNCGTYGFERSGYTPTLKNCLASGNGTADFDSGWNAASNYNVSSDATAPGANSLTSVPPAHIFTNAASDDFSLIRDLSFKPIGVSGTNLSADSSFAFDDDITGTTITGLWPIGAFWPGTPSCRRVAANENISTFGYTGYGRDYTALNTWEDATDTDLITTAKQSEILECYRDNQTEFAVSTRIVISGAITSKWYNRIIRPNLSDRHNGDLSSGVKLNSSVIDHVFGYLTPNEDYGSVQDLVLTCNANYSSAANMAGSDGAANGIFVGLVVDSPSNIGNSVLDSFNIRASSTEIAVVGVNGVSINAQHDGWWTDDGSSGGIIYQYNITSYGSAVDGIHGGSDATEKNCLSTASGGVDFTSAYTGSSNNASEDGTAPGTSSRTLQTFTFVDTDTDNYQLAYDDAGAKGYGVDLSADPTFPFFDDIAGNTRTSPWDIGAFIAASVAIDQEGFRFRDDDGSESAATWLANQDTNVSLTPGSKFRLRFIANASGDPAAAQYKLQFKKTADSVWKDVV